MEVELSGGECGDMSLADRTCLAVEKAEVWRFSGPDIGGLGIRPSMALRVLIRTNMLQRKVSSTIINTRALLVD